MIAQLHLYRDCIMKRMFKQWWSTLIGGVMVSVLASRGFEPRSGLTKGYGIGICCFFASQATCIPTTVVLVS